MVLVYIDDILCIYKDLLVVIDAQESIYVMKQVSMGQTDGWFRAKDGKFIWETHSRNYCKAEISKLEKTLTSDGKILSQYRDGMRPYLSSFRPYIDTSVDIGGNGVHDYQHHIGVLRW